MSSYTQEWMCCRFCGQTAHIAKMVKYGVRHYAHQECYLDRRSIETLHPWQVGHLSWKVLRDRGLEAKAEAIINAERT